MKNSKHLYLIILVMCSLSALSQKDSSSSTPSNSNNPIRFELGTFVYGLTLRPGEFTTRYNMVWDNQAFSGIYYKRYHGKNAFRTSAEFSRRTVYFGSNNFPRNAYYRGELASLELKLGYQRMLGDKKFAPYLFADAEYSYFRPILQPVYYPYYTSSMIVPDYYYQQHYTLGGSFFSISPGFGVRWSVFQHLFINAEASAQLFISRERANYYYESFSSIGINAKPLKLSIGYSF